MRFESPSCDANVLMPGHQSTAPREGECQDEYGACAIDQASRFAG